MLEKLDKHAVAKILGVPETITLADGSTAKTALKIQHSRWDTHQHYTIARLFFGHQQDGAWVHDFLDQYGDIPWFPFRLMHHDTGESWTKIPDDSFEFTAHRNIHELTGQPIVKPAVHHPPTVDDTVKTIHQTERLVNLTIKPKIHEAIPELHPNHPGIVRLHGGMIGDYDPVAGTIKNIRSPLASPIFRVDPKGNFTCDVRSLPKEHQQAIQGIIQGIPEAAHLGVLT